ncbi:MAG: PorT family protein, partial [Prevotellaceae bacterium]|nr:PorT family protein [Prevotellaceae bacterium]
MKKLLVIAALMGLCATAQAKIFAFGVKAGINMPYLETDLKAGAEALKANSNVGFHAGLFGQFNIPVIGLGIQPELLYLNQSISYFKEDGESDYKSGSYLEIPINITWGIDLKVVRPFIALTPYLRYAFSNVETYV